MTRVGLILTLWLMVASSGLARASELTLDRPFDGEFVRDEAGLLQPADVGQISQRCSQLLDDAGVPMFVATFDAMAEFGGEGMSIETFARTVFDDWGQSHPLIQGQEWSNGILFVVSLGDRAARVELGRKWAGAKDADARRIMDQHIIPAFRAGDYARGIVAGVDALDQMARGKAVPTKPVPAALYACWAVFAGLAIFTVVSLARRGSSGWAWLFWSGVLVFVGAVLYHLTKHAAAGSASQGNGAWGRRSSSRRGGMFSGGGRGGGSFGGGGGASGSW